jgi:hypothetical protein
MGGVSAGSLSDTVMAAMDATQSPQALQNMVVSLASGEASAPAAPDGNGSLINVMA